MKYAHKGLINYFVRATRTRRLFEQLLEQGECLSVRVWCEQEELALPPPPPPPPHNPVDKLWWITMQLYLFREESSLARPRE